MKTLSIANGELWLHAPGAGPRQIESPFARELIERDLQSRRNTSWKNAPREQQTGVIPTSSLWGRRGPGGDSAVLQPRFEQARRGDDDDTLYYLLSIGETRGLFRRHLGEDREVRLFHRNGWNCEGFAYNPSDKRLILAAQHANGSAHLEVYDDEGTRRGAITDGDCVDASPSLVPGRSRTVVYQSSGVARHPQLGHVMAVGHACVHLLDYGSGKMEVLLDDPKHDFVAPRMDAQGALYAIRRPALKPQRERAGVALKDTLLMPLRLLKAIFGYLNFFSMVYGKEPLRSAGGPRTPELDQDLGTLWLHGRMIELSKARSDPQYAGNLVPGNWELVRMARAGAPVEVLARHVAGFDVRDDGRIVFTNGYDILELEGGEKRTLARQEQVAGLSAV
ncbi:MAG TPA: hypothetical protein VIP05_18170 [Burkholderiaceae bacterium]